MADLEPSESSETSPGGSSVATNSTSAGAGSTENLGTVSMNDSSNNTINVNVGDSERASAAKGGTVTSPDTPSVTRGDPPANDSKPSSSGIPEANFATVTENTVRAPGSGEEQKTLEPAPAQKTPPEVAHVGNAPEAKPEFSMASFLEDVWFYKRDIAKGYKALCEARENRRIEREMEQEGFIIRRANLAMDQAANLAKDPMTDQTTATPGSVFQPVGGSGAGENGQVTSTKGQGFWENVGGGVGKAVNTILDFIDSDANAATVKRVKGSTQNASSKKEKEVPAQPWKAESQYPGQDNSVSLEDKETRSRARDRAKALIKTEESKSLDEYTDSVGKPTIGWGHRIIQKDRDASMAAGKSGEQLNWTEEQAEAAFEEDFKMAWDALSKKHKDIIDKLDDARLPVFISMVYQLGAEGLGKFDKVLEAMKNGQWEEASKQMIDSRWAEQSFHRAWEAARIMNSGEWPSVPGPDGRVGRTYTPWAAPFIHAAAAFVGEDPILLNKIMGVEWDRKKFESGNSPRAFALESDWADIMKKHPEYGLTEDGWKDPNQQAVAAALKLKDIRAALTTPNSNPTGEELYLSYVLGVDNAKKLITDKNSEAPVTNYTSQMNTQQVKSYEGDIYKKDKFGKVDEKSPRKAKEFFNALSKKFETVRPPRSPLPPLKPSSLPAIQNSNNNP